MVRVTGRVLLASVLGSVCRLRARTACARGLQTLPQKSRKRMPPQTAAISSSRSPRATAVAAGLALVFIVAFAWPLLSRDDQPSILTAARNGAPSGQSSSSFHFLVPGGFQQGLFEAIGSGPGPVVVGGIGDSGTRGTRDVLRYFGVHSCVCSLSSLERMLALTFFAFIVNSARQAIYQCRTRRFKNF